MGRYRFRTWLRSHLPWVVAEWIPKGLDCGDHEWHLIADGKWGCYHCVQTTTESPWSGPEWARIRLRAIYADLAMLMASDLPASRLSVEQDAYKAEIVRLNEVIAMEPVSGQEPLSAPSRPVAQPAATA